jgi:hypothetical protein
MTRVNRPDTLFTQLREIERRLRLLEGGRAAMSTLTSVCPQSLPVPFSPARQEDWPGTDSSEWTDVVRAVAVPGRFQVVVDAVADAGTSGQARVIVNGTPVGEELAVGDRARHVVDVAVEGELGEIAVRVRRVDGDGMVRTTGLLMEM